MAMFKVSFKETAGNPSKIVTNRTTVTLRGVVEIPSFWSQIPESIYEWIWKRKNIELYEDYALNRLIVFSEGKAQCRAGDKFDMIFGERLAEARAKYNIYKFFYKLTCKLEDYYGNILLGNKSSILDAKGGVSGAARKYAELCIRESHHLGELLKDHEEHV